MIDVNYRINEEGIGEESSPGLLALREALVNMLMHADYFSSATSRIRIFTDHVDFFNPGGFPKPLEELKAKDLSLPRNPILTKLFRMVKIAENAGFGLDKIESNWMAYNGTSPNFDIEFDTVMVRLKTVNDSPERVKGAIGLGERLGETEEKIIQAMANDLYVSQTELSEKLAISTTAIEKHIKNLKEKGIIKRVGPARGGHWEVIKRLKKRE